MTDKLCEELAIPVLFPKGRFGYTEEPLIKSSPVKYFNARLLHYSGHFATNSEHLFFAQFIIEQKNVLSINRLQHLQGKPIFLTESTLTQKRLSFSDKSPSERSYATSLIENLVFLRHLSLKRKSEARYISLDSS